jgi:hypothetical protein
MALAVVDKIAEPKQEKYALFEQAARESELFSVSLVFPIKTVI